MPLQERCLEHVWGIVTHTKISHTACTPNAVDILLNITWEIEVHNVLHVWNVQTASSHLQQKAEHALQHSNAEQERTSRADKQSKAGSL